MTTVIYRDGRRVDFPFREEPPEYHLTLACYVDAVERVRAILQTHPTVDVDAAVLHSKSRGNGTPLVLCGCIEIARLLVERGADVNHPYFNGWDQVTPLASARKELTKFSVRTDPERSAGIAELVRYLESVGGRSSAE